MAPVPGQSKCFDTVLNLPPSYPAGMELCLELLLPLENPAALLPFRFLDLPSEIRNMIYTELAVPPPGRALGSFKDCNIKDRRRQGPWLPVCLCRTTVPMGCGEDCIKNDSWRSVHFMHEYTEYRCLDFCCVNKQLYQEFNAIFYTRNTFEFHNTIDMETFLELSTVRHAEKIRNVSLVAHGSRWVEITPNGELWPSVAHSVPERNFSIPSLVRALDHLAKCTSLGSLKVGFEYRVPQELITYPIEDWLDADDTDKYSYVAKEFEKLSKDVALWRWKIDVPTTSAMRPGEQASPLYVAEHNALATFNDEYQETVRKDLESILPEDEVIMDFREDVDFCAKQILLLHRCFRTYKTWQRSVHCPWIEWPRSWAPKLVDVNAECIATVGCHHMRLCLEPGWTPAPKDRWRSMSVPAMSLHPDWEQGMIDGDGDRVHWGNRLLQGNAAHGCYDGVSDNRELELMRQVFKEQRL